MPKKPTPIDPDIQLARFRRACDLLGQRAAARAIGINERSLRYIYAGNRPIHDGFLRDLSRALITLANECRDLERELSPAFAGNLTEQQQARQGKPDARRYDAREKGNG